MENLDNVGMVALGQYRNFLKEAFEGFATRRSLLLISLRVKPQDLNGHFLSSRYLYCLFDSKHDYISTEIQSYIANLP